MMMMMMIPILVTLVGIIMDLRLAQPLNIADAYGVNDVIIIIIIIIISVILVLII